MWSGAVPLTVQSATKHRRAEQSTTEDESKASQIENWSSAKVWPEQPVQRVEGVTGAASAKVWLGRRR